MTKRYNLNLRLEDNDDGTVLLDVNASNKTMETVQQLIRLSMSDMPKVDPTPAKKRRWGRSGRVEPPPIEPTAAEFEDIE